jgi:predicted CXXCH cytochrome family protein
VAASRRGRLALAAVLLFAGAWLFLARGDNAPVGHLAGADCAECHLAGAAVNAGNAAKLVASQEVLCRTCHPDSVKVSHPSGIPPGRPLPAEYPLDWKGDLTCSTCHVPHGSAPGLLRGDKRGKAFCMQCHTAEFFDNMKDTGASIVVSGHLTSGGLDLSRIDLDRYSLQCLGCHVNAADAPEVTIGNDAIVRHGTGTANHPIGRKYGDAERFGGYRPAILLSKKIFLPDGKVSCVSCHEGYSRSHGKLVMSNKGSALCFQCHEK